MAQLHVGRLVLQLVPFVLVVFLKEVAVADLASLDGQLESVGQLLPVLEEEAVAIADVGRQVGAVDAQVVHAAVVQRIEVDQARRRARNAERLCWSR